MNFPAINGIRAIQQGVAPNLGGINQLNNNNPVRNLGIDAAEDTSFDSLFQSYLNMLNEAGSLEMQAQNLQIEFALGNTDDMLSVVLAQEAAYTSMMFAVQITNRMIEAYREIMRMQL